MEPSGGKDYHMDINQEKGKLGPSAAICVVVPNGGGPVERRPCNSGNRGGWNRNARNRDYSSLPRREKPATSKQI